jgi:hypothetical protein
MILKDADMQLEMRFDGWKLQNQDFKHCEAE